jgi:hypothetical protein
VVTPTRNERQKEEIIMGFFSSKMTQGSDGDRNDYQNGAGADDLTKADKNANRQTSMIAAQRGANRRWGKPAESQGDDIEKRNSK